MHQSQQSHCSGRGGVLSPDTPMLLQLIEKLGPVTVPTVPLHINTILQRVYYMYIHVHFSVHIHTLYEVFVLISITLPSKR